MTPFVLTLSANPSNDNHTSRCPACERSPRAPGRDYCAVCDADVAAHIDAAEYFPPEFSDPTFTGAQDDRSRWGED